MNVYKCVWLCACVCVCVALYVWVGVVVTYEEYILKAVNDNCNRVRIITITMLELFKCKRYDVCSSLDKHTRLPNAICMSLKIHTLSYVTAKYESVVKIENTTCSVCNQKRVVVCGVPWMLYT